VEPQEDTDIRVMLGRIDTAVQFIKEAFDKRDVVINDHECRIVALEKGFVQDLQNRLTRLEAAVGILRWAALILGALVITSAWQGLGQIIQHVFMGG
jgi:hypothetical protein